MGRRGGVRVHFVGDNHSANGLRESLPETHGHDVEAIGGVHAGISDTSQLLHIALEQIRTDRLAPGVWMIRWQVHPPET